MSFRCLSEKIISKGLTASKAKSLADMHRRREETQSQYFTPVWVARGIWKSLSGIINEHQKKDKILHIVDTNCGSGRLFEGAPLEHATLYGLDTDSRCINALIHDATEQGINHHFEVGTMAELDISDLDIAVINPAYSIHLESPNLTHFDTNSFGRFGPGTAALSHEYALAQAVDGADVVAAILPVSAEELASSYAGLAAVVYLPQNTFISEGANVKTAVYFFGPECVDTVLRYTITEGCDWPDVPVSLRTHKNKPRFKQKSYDKTKPTITHPVTGDSTVELHHHNRRIVLKFHCGLVQAKVLNGLYREIAREIAHGQRLPATVKYAGEGCLLLDVLLLQTNPQGQLERLIDNINTLGGNAWLSPTLRNYYKKLVKRHQRAVTPMYRMVKSTGTDTLYVTAKRRMLLNMRDFESPAIRKGQKLKVTPHGGEYSVSVDGYSVVLRRDELMKRFEFIDGNDIDSRKTWSLLHKGLSSAFPVMAQMHNKRVESSGIDWLANFQKNSLVEGLINPYGYIGAWEQGSGKARYAIALTLMHSGRNLIVVESGLLPEMLRELNKLGIDKNLWQVLENGCVPTKKINLTTYRTLRQGTKITYQKNITYRGSPAKKIWSKIVRTNAQRWRRQFNTVICDEGGLLANLHTQQTQAVKSLCCRKLIILDGTPQRNYPRDLLPLVVASAGNGVAHQCYGVRGKANITPSMIDSCHGAQRGEDAFYDNHIVTQWVTNEFKEDLQSGGKREVPKINNLNMFREWLSPNIQRRLRSEPELAEFDNCQAPTRNVIDVHWDEPHLAHYLKTATEFADWYKKSKQNSRELNMVTVLARIKAVQRAANSPHVKSDASPLTYSKITSKQQMAIDRLKYHASKNRKSILYASSPEVLGRIQRKLDKQGVKSVLFTGQQNINQRSLALDNEFRFGDTPILLSSWVGQRGLNLEQAKVVIFYERHWSATTEEQAISRTQRPSQQSKVSVEYLHLRGSIDEYCAQLVEWKRKAAEAGLDFGTQLCDEEEFLHLDTILNRFCEDVIGINIHDAKQKMVAR